MAALVVPAPSTQPEVRRSIKTAYVHQKTSLSSATMRPLANWLCQNCASPGVLWLWLRWWQWRQWVSIATTLPGAVCRTWNALYATVCRLEDLGNHFMHRHVCCKVLKGAIGASKQQLSVVIEASCSHHCCNTCSIAVHGGVTKQAPNPPTQRTQAQTVSANQPSLNASGQLTCLAWQRLQP